jgi:hypothetical protein
MHRKIFDRMEKRSPVFDPVLDRIFGAGVRMRFDLGRKKAPAAPPVDTAKDPSIKKIFDKFQGLRILDSE